MSIRSLIPSLWSDENGKDVFHDLQSEVERVFHQFRHLTPTSFGDSKTLPEFSKLLPRMNVAETDNQYEIEVELPGVKQDDVNVTVQNQTLTIEGHKKQESKEEKKDYRIVERSEGSFKRVIPLGFDLEDKDVDAKFKDGVLTIAVTKPAELTQKARKIEIKKAEPA